MSILWPKRNQDEDENPRNWRGRPRGRHFRGNRRKSEEQLFIDSAQQTLHDLAKQGRRASKRLRDDSGEIEDGLTALMFGVILFVIVAGGAWWQLAAPCEWHRLVGVSMGDYPSRCIDEGLIP